MWQGRNRIVGVHVLIGLLLSAAIGLSLGLIGGGGSIITVPVLVYVLGVDAHQAIGMSLAVVGATSLVGARLHYRRGTVDIKIGALFGASGIAGAYFGSHLTYLLSPAALLLVFAALMIVISSLMLFRKSLPQESIESRDRSVLKAVAAGLIVGLLTGFLGVGGGFLIVPALTLFGGLEMKRAIGTSLFVIAINCVAGLAGHLGHGSFDLQLTALVTLLAVTGALAGTMLSHKVSSVNLSRAFSVFVLAVAMFLVAKNYAVIIH